jgi:hypothetical protein
MTAPGKGLTKPATSKEIAEAAGFESRGLGEVADQVGAVAAIAREESELKAAIVVAKRFPRDEATAFAKLMKSCERPTMAEHAVYSFPRGGAKVEGPSISMAREAARCWGNIRFGCRIVSDDEEQLHIKGWALDLEVNNYIEEEDKFAKLIFRKKGGWQKPDERDLRELKNRRGAICVRNCLLQVLPPDVIDDAVRQVKETLRKAASGELKQNRTDAIRRLAKGFLDVGVSVDLLERKLQHKLETVTEAEIVELRGIWSSIADSNSQVKDHFQETSEPKEPEGAVDVTAALGASAKVTTPPAKTSAAAAPAGDPPPMSDAEKERAAQKERDDAGPDPKAGEKKGSLFPGE